MCGTVSLVDFHSELSKVVGNGQTLNKKYVVLHSGSVLITFLFLIDQKATLRYITNSEIILYCNVSGEKNHLYRILFSPSYNFFQEFTMQRIINHYSQTIFFSASIFFTYSYLTSLCLSIFFLCRISEINNFTPFFSTICYSLHFLYTYLLVYRKKF